MSLQRPVQSHRSSPCCSLWPQLLLFFLKCCGPPVRYMLQFLSPEVYALIALSFIFMLLTQYDNNNEMSFPISGIKVCSSLSTSGACSCWFLCLPALRTLELYPLEKSTWQRTWGGSSQQLSPPSQQSWVLQTVIWANSAAESPLTWAFEGNHI